LLEQLTDLPGDLCSGFQRFDQPGERRQHLPVHLLKEGRSALPNPIAALQHIHTLLDGLQRAFGIVGLTRKTLRDFAKTGVV
jgi:hypothetical protein